MSNKPSRRFQCYPGLRPTERRGENHAIPLCHAHVEHEIQAAMLTSSLPPISTPSFTRRKRKRKKNKQTRKVLPTPPVPSLTPTHSPALNSESCTASSLPSPSLTSSSLVCLQGKEKVRPRGNFLWFSPLVFMKSARQPATYSNSCGEEKAQDTGLKHGHSDTRGRGLPSTPQSPCPGTSEPFPWIISLGVG